MEMLTRKQAIEYMKQVGEVLAIFEGSNKVRKLCTNREISILRINKNGCVEYDGEDEESVSDFLDHCLYKLYKNTNVYDYILNYLGIHIEENVLRILLMFLDEQRKRYHVDIDEVLDKNIKTSYK